MPAAKRNTRFSVMRANPYGAAGTPAAVKAALIGVLAFFLAAPMYFSFRQVPRQVGHKTYGATRARAEGVIRALQAQQETLRKAVADGRLSPDQARPLRAEIDQMRYELTAKWMDGGNYLTKRAYRLLRKEIEANEAAIRRALGGLPAPGGRPS